MAKKKRNYKREYALYHGSAKQKRRRAQRNTSRAKMVKAGKARKGDGKDTEHKNHNTADQSAGNMVMMSKSRNRAKNKGKGGRPKKGTRKRAVK